MQKNYFYFLCLLVFGLGSCKIQEDLDELRGNYDPEFALPLFYSKFNIKDVVGSKNAASLKIDAENKMTFYYKSNFTERKATDILSIFNGSVIPLVFEDTVSYPNVLYSSEMKIKKIHYKKGVALNMFYQMITPGITEPVDVTMGIPTLKKNGVSFTVVRSNLTLSTTSPTAVLFGQDLEGYILTPFPVDTTTIKLFYRAKTKSGQDVKIRVLGGVSNPAFTYIEGFVPKKDIKIDAGSVDVSLYNQIVKGDLKFEDPRISVLVENSYGYPMRTKVNLIKSISKRGDTISLSSSQLINDGFDFPYPTLQEIGQTKKLRFDFNNSNSNIKDVLNSGPNTILYSIDAVANPNNDTQNGFMTDSTTLKIGLEVEIPVWGSATNFEVRDTIENINLSSLDNAQSAEIKFVADNEMPVGIALKVYFLDNNNQVLDELSSSALTFIGAAPVDSKGNANGISTKEAYVPISAEKIAKIKTATRMSFIANFNTTGFGATPVRILASQNLNLRAGLKVIPKL